MVTRIPQMQYDVYTDITEASRISQISWSPPVAPGGGRSQHGDMPRSARCSEHRDGISGLYGGPL